MAGRVRHRSRHLPSAVSRTTAALATTALLAACSTGSPSASPSSSPSAATRSPTPAASPSPVSEQQEVTSTYLTFWNVSAQAERTGNAAAAQAVLAPYVSPTYIN